MIQRLKEISIISAGQNAPQGETSYSKDGISFIKAGHLSLLTNGLSEQNLPKVSSQIALKYKLKLYKAGSILFAKSGMSCMKNYIYQMLTDSYVVNHLAIITPFEQEMGNYLKYYFQWNKPNKLVKDESYPSISLTEIGNLEVNTYDYETRKYIVDKLNKLTLIIEKREKQLKKLEELAMSRFIEMFGDPITNPKGWELKKISEVSLVRIGPFGSLLHVEDYIADKHPVINPSHIVGDVIIPNMALTISEKKYKELFPYHLRIGDIVLGRRGEIGRCAIVLRTGLVCGTGNMFIRLNTMKCKVDFLQKIISYPSYKLFLEDKAVGVTMKNLNAKTIENSPFPLPPIELQNEFSAFIEQLDKSKVTIRQSLEKLQLTYKALLQEYFG